MARKWGEKPNKPALPLIMPESNAIPAALNSMYTQAARHPYVMPNLKYFGVIGNQASQSARPIIARLAFFNFWTTNNGKKRQ